MIIAGPERDGRLEAGAVVLYGVGHQLDSEPDLFFRLRGVNQHDLIAEALSNVSFDTALGLD